VVQYNNYDRYEQTRTGRTGYAEWIALGAIAAGSVGAVVGLAASRRGRTSLFLGDQPIAPDSITAPHGDKLRGAVI